MPNEKPHQRIFRRLVEDGTHRFLPDNGVRQFSGVALDRQKHVYNALKFAYEMVYGSGHHRKYRTGGQHSRRKGELFCNTFQGKLAEIFLHDQLTTAGFNCGKLDFGIYGERVWDDMDLTVEERTISIKSAAYFSQLLLLEVDDWTIDGKYQPNVLSGQKAIYDYFVLIRIQPDIKNIFRHAKKFYADALSKQEALDLTRPHQWQADFAGAMSRDDLKWLIRHQLVLEKNTLLKGRTTMDASNYYALSQDMWDWADFIKILRMSRESL